MLRVEDGFGKETSKGILSPKTNYRFLYREELEECLHNVQGEKR